MKNIFKNNAAGKRPALQPVLLALTVAAACLFPSPGVPAATDAEIIQAAARIHSGNATYADRALALTNNGRLNTLARAGNINQAHYNSAQSYFSEVNSVAAQRAAKNAGVSIRLQPRKPGMVGYNPGTDTDLIVYSPDGKTLITKQQLNALDSAHQAEMKKILRAMGQRPPAGRIDANTDFMPHPDHTTREVFTQQANEINARGGAAYTDPAAVRVEYEMRNPDGPGRIPPDAAGRYVQQQQFHADRHFKAAEHLNHQANSLEREFGPNPTAAQKSQVAHIRESAKILEQNGAKYVERINSVTDTVARQNRVSLDRGPETDLDRAARRAAGPRKTAPGDPPPTRNLKVTAADMAAAKTAGLSQQLTRKAVLSHTEVMSRIAATNPGQAAAARESIARAMGGLPPAQQGEIIQGIERTAGKAFARDVARQARHFQKPVPPTAAQTLTKKAMQAAGTTMKAILIFNIAADVKEIVTADDPKAVLAEKAYAYADGMAGGVAIERHGDFENLQVEHDQYLRDAENVIYSAVEAKLRRMGVSREEARKIANDFYRGHTESFRNKAEELRAAGIRDPHPERGGLDPISMWDQDDNAFERILQVGEGILHSAKRAGTFVQEAVSDTKEILVGLGETGVLKELIWERDPRLLVDIFHEWRRRSSEGAMSREQMIEYLEALGASPVGARRATEALLDDGNVSEFRRLVGVLQEKQAQRIAQEASGDDEFEGEFPGPGDRPAGAPLDIPDAVAEIVDGTGVKITRDEKNIPPGGAGPGGEVMSASGSWSKAYGGWRTEEVPPNKPKRVGPFSVRPGKYRAELRYSPDIAPSMTAGNWNTGMSVTFSSKGTGESGGSRVAGIQNIARNKPSGEGSQEFSIDRPGQLYVNFSVAASRGQAGGYAEHEQSYSGKIVLVESSLSESATAGTDLASGDTVHAGRGDAVLSLRDGTLMTLRAGSEARLEMTEDDRVRVVLIKGSGRFTKRGELFGQLEVVAPDGRTIFRPEGTDFEVSAAGAVVFEGKVAAESEGAGTAVLEAGTLFNAETGEASVLEGGREAALSPDGFPLLPEYWRPEAEPYGRKDFRIGEGGWLFADPPARWNPPAGRGTPPAAMEVTGAGALKLTVPAISRLDDGGNTAPRLLHRVTGDFIMEAKAVFEGGGTGWTGLQFIARAPGSFIGSLQGHFPRTSSDGPGQHYWLGPYSMVRASGGLIRLPALNESSHSHWPEAGPEPVSIMAARLGDLLVSYWSRDGENWHVSGFTPAPLPETVWAGWAFIHSAPGAPPAEFTLSGIRLITAPKGSLEPPPWHAWARNGIVEQDGTSVRLRLDGENPGSARAFLGDLLEGDFDVDVSFSTESGEKQAEGAFRWTLAAVSPDERGPAVGCHVNSAVQRYGVVNETTPGYNPRTAQEPASGPVEETSGRLRLVRRGGVISAYYWRGGEWNYFREAGYGNRDRGGFEGPLFLRLEASNGQAGTTVPPVNVAFKLNAVYSSPEEREKKEPPAAETAPGLSAEEAAALSAGVPVRSTMPADGTQHWYAVSIPGPGSLTVSARGYDVLRFGLEIHHRDRAVIRQTPSRTHENSVSRPGISAGDYLIRLARSGGDGPYIIEAVHEPQEITGDDEPNDTFEQAQEIRIDEKIHGLIGYGNPEYTDSADWFSFTTEKPGDVTVEAEGEETLANFYLHLHNADGRRELARDISGTRSSRKVERGGLLPGTYFIQVRRLAGYGAYTLHPRLNPVPIEGDAEPNDTFDQAQEIRIDKKIRGLIGYGNMRHTDRADWFKFMTEKPGDISVEAEGDETLTNFYLYLHDADGRRELARDVSGSSNSRKIKHGGLLPGTYFIQVRQLAGYGAYTLHPRLDPASIEGDAEPNDTFEQAQEIKINEKIEGLIGYGNMRRTDNSDWFRFTTTRPGNVIVEAEGEGALSGFYLFLYDEDGRRELGRDTSGTDNSRKVERGGLLPGTYFVQVRQPSGYGAYTLKPGFTPAAVEGDAEPNDTFDQAQEIRIGEKIRGLLGYGNMRHTDRADWFKFTTIRPGSVAVEAEGDESLTNFHLYLHDTDGRRELARDISGTAGSRKVERTGLPPGTYFIQVRQPSGYGAYALNVRFSP